jgi:hypothetical protein
MKILNLIVAIFTLSLPIEVVASVEIPQLSRIQNEVEATKTVVDPRIEKLNEFFRNYSCPQPFRSEQYILVADKYEIPYTLLPVISLKESSCGKKVFRQNNWWGYGSVRFLSLEEGMDFIAKQLSSGKYYKGKTLVQKLKTYNSINKNYPSHALQLMSKIEN